MTAPMPASAFFHDPVPQYDAAQLTQGGSLARLVLDGQVYTLRITRQGKLILTK